MVHIFNIMNNYNQPGYGNDYSERTAVGDYPANGTIMVSNSAKYTLQSITKWVKFLSILGIISGVFIIIIGFGMMIFGGFAGSRIGEGAALGAFAGLLYIVIGALCLYPVIQMLNYANKMKTAIMLDSQDYYEKALDNFNSAVKFWGIFAIISLAIWVLFIIFGILGAAML